MDCLLVLGSGPASEEERCLCQLDVTGRNPGRREPAEQMGRAGALRLLGSDPPSNTHLTQDSGPVHAIRPTGNVFPEQRLAVLSAVHLGIPPPAPRPRKGGRDPPH